MKDRPVPGRLPVQNQFSDADVDLKPVIDI